jgi:hypothetical protein
MPRRCGVINGGSGSKLNGSLCGCGEYLAHARDLYIDTISRIEEGNREIYNDRKMMIDMTVKRQVK